jgi:site-specific DNA recombinase
VRGHTLSRMKAVLYLRSSKDRSDVSIDAQRRALHELAEKRDILIMGEYADAVESGKDDDRPGFQNLLRDMRSPARLWDTVLALDTARIARRRHISLIFEEQECKKRGIRVIYNSVPETDPITEMLLKSILQAMDEWHSLTSKAKGLAGMAENVRQGWRAGGRAPKGYKLQHIETGAIRDGEPVTKSKLILDDDALKVRAYLQARSRGVQRNQAAAASGLDLSASSLIDLERNALTYAGHTVWNRMAEKGEHGYVGGSRFRPRSEWVIQENTHEPLISQAEADTILATLENKSKTRKRVTKRVYLFAGIMKSPDGRRWHGDGGSYRLEGNGPRVLAENVEQPALRQLVADLLNERTVGRILQYYKTAFAKTSANIDKELKRLKQIDKSIDTFSNLLEQTSKPEALLRKIEALEDERTDIAARVARYRDDEEMSHAMRTLTPQDVRSSMKVIVAGLMESDPYALRDALHQLLVEVTLDPETFSANFTWRLPGESGDKVASPRGAELNSGYSASFSLQVARRQRLA